MFLHTTRQCSIKRSAHNIILTCILKMDSIGGNFENDYRDFYCIQNENLIHSIVVTQEFFFRNFAYV